MPSFYPNARQSLDLLLRLLLFTLLIFLPYLLYRVFSSDSDWPNATDSLVFYISKLAAQFLFVIFATQKLRKLETYHFKAELNLKPQASWLYAFACGLGLILLTEPLEILLPPSERLQHHFANLSQYKTWSALCVIILSPALNELIFRGIILRGLLRNYSPAFALLLSSAFFSIFHISLLQAVVAFILSIFFGFVYWQTRSLALVVLLHISNNGLAYFILWIAGRLSSFEQLIKNTSIYLLVYLLAATLVYLGLLQVYKLNEARK